MPGNPRTVIFFDGDQRIDEKPYSQVTDDPYFPTGKEIIELSGRKYAVGRVREVQRRIEGEMCVQVTLLAE